MSERIKNFFETNFGLIILSAVPVVAWMFPIFIGYRVAPDPASYFVYYYWEFFQEAMQQGESMLWNPYSYSGFPTFVTYSGLFSPIHFILLKIFSAWTAYVLLVLLTLVFASFFTAKFLQRLGVSTFSALTGGITWVMPQLWMGAGFNPAHLYPVLFLPLLFFVIWEINSKKWWYIPVAILSVVLTILTFHWHWTILTIIGVAVWGAYLWRRDLLDLELMKSRRSFFNRHRMMLLLLLIMCIGGLIGLIQLIPSTVYLSLSDRAEGIKHWPAVGLGYTPIDLIGLFFPTFNPWFVPISHLYFGIVPLFFMVYAFTLKKSGFRSFFSWFTLIVIVLSIHYSPLFWLLHHIPPITFLHAASRWMFIGAFLLSILAAFGIDKFCRDRKDGKISRRSLISLKIFGWSTAVFTVIIFFSTIADLFFKERILNAAFRYFDLYMYENTTKLPIAFYHAYITKQISEALSWFSLAAYMVSAVTLFLITGYYFLKKIIEGRVKSEFIPFFTCLIVILNFTFAYLKLNSYVPGKIVTEVPETVKFLKRNLGNDRYLVPFGVSTAYISAGAVPGIISLEDKAIIENAFVADRRSMSYWVSDVDYFDPLASRRMGRVTGYISGAGLSGGGSLDVEVNKESLSGARIPIEEKIKLMAERMPLMDFLGVRYLLSGIELNVDGLKKVFETKISSYEIPVYIYEKQAPRSRFYFASFLETIPENEEAAFQKLKTISKEGLGVFIECGRDVKVGPCVQGPTLDFDGKGELEVIIKKNTLSILKTKSQTPQFLVFSENHLPGWKAYVDSQQVPIYTVGSVYMGVAIPEGGHEVKFEFTYWTIVQEFLKKYLRFTI